MSERERPTIRTSEAERAVLGEVAEVFQDVLAGSPGSYKYFWTLFGTSNQLLASLSLLAITVWLKKLGKPIWFTLAPMVLVFAVTVVSLVLQIKQVDTATAGSIAWLNGLVSLILLGLALILVYYAVRAWRAMKPAPARVVERG